MPEQGDRQKRTLLRGAEGDGDPLDLLDAAASRRMLHLAVAPGQRALADDFARDTEGRMVIREEAAPSAGEPRRGVGISGTYMGHSQLSAQLWPMPNAVREMRNEHNASWQPALTQQAYFIQVQSGRGGPAAALTTA